MSHRSYSPDIETWVATVRVNLWALTEVTAAVLPGMVERGRGAVVNVGSGSGSVEGIPSLPLYTVYSASKRYVAHFSRSLYVEYKSKGIDVQCQVPLFTETNMTSHVAGHQAAHWIGHGPFCIPHLGHRLQWCVFSALPDSLLLAMFWDNVRRMPQFHG